MKGEVEVAEGRRGCIGERWMERYEGLQGEKCRRKFKGFV